MPSTKPAKQLKLRVFAGPNGSGKSTVIQYVRSYKTNKGSIEFGYYINADEIACELEKGVFDFGRFDVVVSTNEFRKTCLASGLVNDRFTEIQFSTAYNLRSNKLTLKNPGTALENKEIAERIAQVVADYLRKKLLHEQKRFSFETVFSHSSKLDIMKEAKALGYKVYLYFVSTESPEINIARVESRKAQGGHDVPKI